MVTKNFIITEKGRKNDFSSTRVHRDIDRIVCATEYEPSGQSSLYSTDYYKDNRKVGVSISANSEGAVESYAKAWIDLGYLQED